MTGSDGPRPSVCIVTSEAVGLFRNGGIGTSMTGLAETLARADFPVTIFYTGGALTPEADLKAWERRYADIGIALAWPDYEQVGTLAGAPALAGGITPWLVYRYLRAHRFDIVQFNDCIGEGALALVMKRLGTAFAGQTFCVALHSPSQWVFEADRVLPSSTYQAAINYDERQSTRCADLLWSPSRYLLEWIDARGFATPPGATYVQQYAIPSRPLFDTIDPAADAAPPGVSKPREIVFFGRLEERKGLSLFCETIGQMHDRLADAGVSVVFLGKSGLVGPVTSEEFVASHAGNWRCAWRIEIGLGQQEAIAYLRDNQALAVMASPLDNSPCTVYEALAFHIPFVATRAGGIPEIIAAEDHARVLFEYNAGDLGKVIERALRDGAAPARPAQTQADIRRTWATTFADLSGLVRTDAPAREARRVVHALIDHVDGMDLERSLTALGAIPAVVHITVINRAAAGIGPLSLVPDAVVTEASASTFWSARETGREVAILLLRSGVTLDPSALDALLDALRSPEADGLVPAARYNGGPRPQVMPPLGGSPGFAFFESVAVTGGLIVKADRLAALISAHAPMVRTEFFGLADIAVVQGLALWPYAEPVFTVATLWNRDHAGLGATDRIAAYRHADPTERYYIEAIGYSAAVRVGDDVASRPTILARVRAAGFVGSISIARRLLGRRARGLIRR